MKYPTEKQKKLINDTFEFVSIYFELMTNIRVYNTYRSNTEMTIAESQEFISGLLALKELLGNINKAIKLNEYKHAIYFVKIHNLDVYLNNVGKYIEMPSYSEVEEQLINHIVSELLL